MKTTTIRDAIEFLKDKKLKQPVIIVEDADERFVIIEGSAQTNDAAE
jgi:hypothetical protein